MRVLLTDQFGEIGGAQRGLLEAAEGFAAKGWDAHAVVPDGPLVEKLRAFCASVTLIPCGPYQSVNKTMADGIRFARDVRTQAAAMADIAESRNIDVLYVNGPRVLPSAVWARKGRPVVFHSHSVVTQGMAAKLAGRAVRWADAQVIASSHFVAQWLEPFVPQGRVRIVYNGIRDLGMSVRARNLHTRIGVLGRIAAEKGQLTFVRAARVAAAIEPELSFCITGAPVFGSQDYVDAVRREAGDLVTFSDWTEDIGAFFAGIDVLVVPSEAVDANPRVIPEAYAAGVPVIAFDSGGVSELLSHNETGLLVQEHSVEALAAAMCSAVHRTGELNQMAINGHKRWQERYTLPRFQSEVCEALERAAEGRSPVPSARASASA